MRLRLHAVQVPLVGRVDEQRVAARRLSLPSALAQDLAEREPFPVEREVAARVRADNR